VDPFERRTRAAAFILRLWDAARKTICPVPLERPRDLFHLHDDERFRKIYDTLWDDLEEEVAQAAEARMRGARRA
jgi:hypothetical protein